MSDICNKHFVMGCVLCKTVVPEPDAPRIATTVFPPSVASSLSEQPPTITDPEANEISLVAEKYAVACQRVKDLEKLLERAKLEFTSCTRDYTLALEEKKAAKARLAEVVKEE